ncbi:opine metallophore biosynthesis dehydrogenase [Bacillus sp. CGMCC 1.16541]|uniref:opine metallophore biosynthesis dehydrogenase n=1 Tax=Bacillus sp. CGMCC 1.16541 TaxID=2185143 RepID=UPI000D72862C|nr:opine metallophore biosynthesis dehydrogenase [Bacillus sp. CGMCC 1.16541]
MNNFQRVLVAGTGPASVQLAVHLKQRMNSEVGMVGRFSVRSESFFEAVVKHNHLLRAHVQNEQHEAMKGECFVDQLFQGYETVQGSWDTLMLSVTTDAYMDVLTKLDVEVLKQVRCIILISPTFGSNSLVTNYMRSLGLHVEVISFSTYYGDTRWIGDKPSNEVITTGKKKKTFMGSTHGFTVNVQALCQLYSTLGIHLEVMKSPMEAETRNISLYVHPPLFMNEFSLDVIFKKIKTRKHVYKLYPEGPITQPLIRNMLAQWKEMMAVLAKLGIEGVNLLKFMVDDNYPIRPESLAREDIDQFTELEAIHQEYSLYVRYASLLIDPFSEPDEEGRYFDFSAVPIRTIFTNQEGKLDIPRMPKEDYYRIKIIQGIARHVEVDCPTLDLFINTYEQKRMETAHTHQEEALSEAFFVQDFASDIERICEELTEQA